MAKLLQVENLKVVRERFNNSLRKTPSDGLVKIVEEILIETEKDEHKKSRRPEKVARGLTPEAES